MELRFTTLGTFKDGRLSSMVRTAKSGRRLFVPTYAPSFRFLDGLRIHGIRSKKLNDRLGIEDVLRRGQAKEGVDGMKYLLGSSCCNLGKASRYNGQAWCFEDGRRVKP